MTDKRKYLRFDFPLNVDLLVQGEKDVISAVSKDFSREGIRVTLDHEVRARKRDVELSLHLVDKPQPVLGKGRIAWAKTCDKVSQLGIHLKEIDSAAKSDILGLAFQNWRAQA